MDISDMRREFESAGLQRETLNDNPVQQFETWFQDARTAGLLEPNAMSLATVDEHGQPTLRTVLLKYFDENGFVFFTNYESRKARNIEDNHRAAILFPWIALNRQVSVQGAVRRISKAESFKYFSSRPRESQIGAWVSDQSKAISSRGLLEQKLAEMKRKFGQGEIPLPSFWGGYQIVPERIEFWQGRPHRLHDRFEYLRTESGWAIQRLQP
ncbi:MAG: pyridoxamine 5'-phosphate oxidase [Pseudomonadales bacterium]|uniref:pyridoxamine 5'-phosphate oxidase n=1 Tax=unclassified Ketobacter TaxID=2639109 RepID=UPI000C97C9DF|nr:MULTISPECIES: pyridoxamine 5'-phosphate oxidase [unclassified Ketobacter]MAQ26413.1 pyridoxamine 5'-phosphate oxidase [Pseudomonadales bacterium]MEC8813054.1 pyridoxamine 5'-phosphate oxidase [Pseudomonadota bacterium]TNC88514.1 MAG: pyridoxamine 5'-phosphate oxidase [Alcanivorax sp.]HAG96653.1 pyridoxamine 5'-phosphate oxidase [Gammaproteobacteria bacterium]RLT89775.1 MAG: pyridoxamine 5'-phosphate oxidase [Ketobacter sp. GenoA1]